MNTTFLLMAEYETSNIPLSAISEKYLGMKPDTAARKADAGELPFPTFRIGKTQKSQRVVSVVDLAEHIDAERAKAKAEIASVSTKKK